MTTTTEVTGELAQMRPVGLTEMNQTASLQHRMDVKYLIELPVLAAALQTLNSSHRRLVIDEVSSFGYRSVYFDSVDLQCFRAHRQGSRHRFKVRTRCYQDTHQYQFEVKLKDGRGATVKHALPAGPDAFAGIQPAGHEFLNGVLRAAQVPQPPDHLLAALLVQHQRSTLMSTSGDARITIDTDLGFSLPDQEIGSARLREGWALVETKSAQGRSLADAALRGVGARPASISKYALGTCLTRPHVPDQPWTSLLRRHFTPAATPTPSTAEVSS
jgi:hypothetical protein